MDQRSIDRRRLTVNEDVVVEEIVRYREVRLDIVGCSPTEDAKRNGEKIYRARRDEQRTHRRCGVVGCYLIKK